MPITIHNNQYYTVAERLQMVRDDKDVRVVSFRSEVLGHTPAVVKVTVVLMRKIENDWFEQTYEGVSAANPLKSIEKMSPYEVAETSACGRALGFAGYGSLDSVASADEVIVAQKKEAEAQPGSAPVSDYKCETCGKPATLREGVSKKSGKPYKAIMCSSQEPTHTKWINDTTTYDDWGGETIDAMDNYGKE